MREFMKKFVIAVLVLNAMAMTSFSQPIYDNKYNSTKSAIQHSSFNLNNTVTQVGNIDYNAAISELQSKISQNPNDNSLYISLAELYIRSKQTDKAFQELIYLVNQSKKNKLSKEELKSADDLEYSLNRQYKTKSSDLYCELALLNLIVQDNVKAQAALSYGTNSSLFIETYKEVFNITGDYRSAIELADNLLIKNPNLTELRRLKGFYLLQLNQETAAAEEFSTLLIATPDDEEVKYNLYKILKKNNIPEKEIIKQVCVSAQGNEEKALSELSDLLLKNNDFASAKIYAEKLVNKYPENANGYIVLSEIYRREGNLKDCYDVLKLVRDKADNNEAIAKYNVMLAKLSDEPVKEADLLMNNGLYQQALSVLESSNQENLYVMLGMARANYFLNNKQKTFELLNKAMSLYPDNPDMFYYFAYIFYKENDFESARNYISKALEVSPSHKFSLDLLDVINKTEADKYLNQINYSIDNQNYKEAMRLVDEALKIDLKNSNLYYLKGVIYISLNNYAAATAPLYKAIELDKNNYSAYYYLGVAFDNLSEQKNALEYYKKYLQYLPSDDYGESEKKEYANVRIKKLSQ